jgi:(R,R)-butanediol dehydrogenase / meso-butanediol dehydrogenase / diacetyl reductase
VRISVLSDNQVGLTEVEPARLGPGEVRVAVAYVGICGSDLHAIAGPPEELGPDPRFTGLGHEYAGVVAELGEGADRFAIGDPVVGMPRWACLECEDCAAGRLTHCRQPTMPARGAWAEEIVVPERILHLLPAELELRRAALVEPLSCALRGVVRAGAEPGHLALVIGGGPIGALTAALALRTGARQVLVSEPRPERREVLAALGATPLDPAAAPLAAQVAERSGGRGVDVAYEAVGAAATVAEAIELVGTGGTVVVLGVAPASDTLPLSPQDVFLRELSILGAFGPERAFPEAIGLAAALDLEPLLSNCFPLGQLERAVEVARGEAAGKVLLAPGVGR